MVQHRVTNPAMAHEKPSYPLEPKAADVAVSNPWSVSVNGTIKEAMEQATTQSDANIALGAQTQEQKRLILEAIGAIDHDYCAGNFSGNPDGTMNSDIAGKDE